MSFCDFHTMRTKSGRVFTPLDSYDVVDAIRAEMGDEIADEVKGWLEENARESQLADTDYFAMEQEVEDWHNFVDDLSNEIEQVRQRIEDNKLTKAKISIELWKIYEKMRKEL